MTSVRVENISKRYYLGDKMPNSFRDLIANTVRVGRHAKKKDEIWALKNVTFDVAEGETLGIIGRNGAGKSTF